MATVVVTTEWRPHFMRTKHMIKQEIKSIICLAVVLEISEGEKTSETKLQ